MDVSSERDELTIADTIGILRMPGVRPRRCSAGLGWPGMYVSTQLERPYRARFAAVRSHLVILHLNGPVTVTAGAGGAARRSTLPAGGFFLHPAGEELAATLGGDLRTVHVNLDDALLREAAGGRPVRLASHHRRYDPMIERLLLAMDDALRHWQPSARTYADHLAAMLAAHLVYRYNLSGPKDEPPPGGSRLADRQLGEAIDMMRLRLAEPIPLADLAAAASLSTSQLIRRFKAATGLTPHRYLVRLRLRQAVRELRDGDRPIAEIAVSCGFSHQEHLTRTMRARLGTTPAQVRRGG